MLSKLTYQGVFEPRGTEDSAFIFLIFPDASVTEKIWRKRSKMHRKP